MHFSDYPGTLRSAGLLLACLLHLESRAGPAMSEIATEAVRPAGSPEYADVSLRYGWVRSGFPSVQDAQDAIASFHATRVDWFYPGSHNADAGAIYVTTGGQGFIDWCHANGMKIVGAMSTLTTTAAWDSGANTNGGRYRGDPNNPAYAAEAVRWGKALVDAGVDAIVIDDFFGYNVESDRQAFNDNVIAAIKAYAPDIKIASNKGHTLGTLYVAPYDFDFHYSDSNFIPDPSDWWDASKAHRTQQSAFLSHPNINMSNAQRRQLIALGYAAGAHLMAPWDEWLSGGNPRLFADPADFADLYGFARSLGQRGYLNGYEDAAVGGYDLTETRYGATPPLSVSGGSGSLSVFARAQPGETAAPVVLHLVELGTAQASTLRVRIDSLFNSANVECTLFTPSAYDETTHSTASSSGDYSSLAQATTLPSGVDGDELVISLPALSPWAVLVIASTDHRINISPATAQVFTGENQNYTATIVGPDGSPLSPQPSLNWSVDTGGSISTDGLFTAGVSPATGTVTATVTLDGGDVVTGSQVVRVIDGTEQEIIARWPLDGDANDSVGSHHGSVLGGAVFSTDRKEGSHSILLDGSNDYIEIPDHSDLDVRTGDFSYALWFKRDANAATNLRLLSKGSQDNADTGYAVWGSDTSVTAALCNGTSRIMVTAAHGGVGVWTHLAVSIERGTGLMKLYIDGTQDSQVDISAWAGQNIDSIQSLKLGNSSKSDILWDGRIDDMRVFQRALSPAEVAGLMSVTNTAAPTPDPMTWESPPEATGPNSIRMVATTATDGDGGGIQYWFDETSGNPGAVDSGWQDSPVFEPNGLSPSTTYTYRVKVRDISDSPNVTAFSPSHSATTDAVQFSNWIAGYSLTDTSFNGDDDGDGLSNGVEAFFGTNPGVSNPGLIEISMETDTMTFRHPNPDTQLNDVTGSYEWSPDLVNWYAADNSEGDGNTTVSAVATPNSPAANVTTVEAAIGGTVPSRIFIRAAATTP